MICLPVPPVSKNVRRSRLQKWRLHRKVRTLRKRRFKCAYCGKDLLSNFEDFLHATIDHVVPLKAGGADDLSNRLPACRTCNHVKADAIVRNIQHAREIIAVRRSVLAMRHALILASVRKALPAPVEVA